MLYSQFPLHINTEFYNLIKVHHKIIDCQYYQAHYRKYSSQIEKYHIANIDGINQRVKSMPYH